MSLDLAEYLKKQLAQARDTYSRDLDAMSEADLAHKPSETARTPYDFTYEVAVVNRRIAKRILGEDPGAYPFLESWAVAPADLQSKSAIQKEFSESMDALDAAATSDPTRMVALPSGEQTVFELANFAALHVVYHAAQLNYIQASLGDTKMHWSDD